MTVLRFLSNLSEDQLQPELEDSPKPSGAGMEKAVCADTTWIPSGVVRPAIATDACIHGSPPNVIEHIECLSAELEIGLFAMERDVLEQTRIPIPLAGHVKDVASGITEGQPARRAKCAGVVKQRGKDAGNIGLRGSLINVAANIWIGSGPDAVRHTGIITENAISDTEGRSGMEADNAGKLPASERTAQYRIGMLEEWQVINVAARQDVALIKVGTGARSLQVIGVHKSPIVAIRRVVDGMAVSIGEAELSMAHRAAQIEFQGVITRIRLGFEKRDVAISSNGTVGVRRGDVAAGHIQIHGSLAGHRLPIHRQRAGTANV